MWLICIAQRSVGNLGPYLPLFLTKAAQTSMPGMVQLGWNNRLFNTKMAGGDVQLDISSRTRYGTIARIHLGIDAWNPAVLSRPPSRLKRPGSRPGFRLCWRYCHVIVIYMSFNCRSDRSDLAMPHRLTQVWRCPRMHLAFEFGMSNY